MIQPFTLAQLSACVHHSAPVLEGHVVPQTGIPEVVISLSSPAQPCTSFYVTSLGFFPTI